MLNWLRNNQIIAKGIELIKWMFLLKLGFNHDKRLMKVDLKPLSKQGKIITQGK